MLCYDCPRMCGVDRQKAEGFCGQGEKIRVAKIIENFMWEEPCISGDKGALAIFFSGCNLRCEFCQNYKISHKKVGNEYSPEEFRKLLLSYDLSTFSSIDLITPSHFSSAIVEALKGLKLPIPIVWNSSGYEREEVIEKVAGVVDVFLPDLKYFDEVLSMKNSKAKDYFLVASRAIAAMKKAKPQNIFNGDVMFVFSIPMLYSKDDIDDIFNFNQSLEKSKIVSFYDSIPYGTVFSGCKDNSLSFVGLEQTRGINSDIKTDDDFFEFVKYVKNKGFEFVYLLNGTRGINNNPAEAKNILENWLPLTDFNSIQERKNKGLEWQLFINSGVKNPLRGWEPIKHLFKPMQSPGNA